MMWTGTPASSLSYGDLAAEAKNVHDALGVIDVSTLGKLLVIGPDAAEFLERLYPNRFGDMKRAASATASSTRTRGGSWTTARSPASQRRTST